MELVLVLFIVALLAAIAVPNIQGSITRAREASLTENLVVMRRAIDDFHADRGAYPDSLAALVEARYIRFVPEDPIGGEETPWRLVEDTEAGGVRDVFSGADGVGTNGVAYGEW